MNRLSVKDPWHIPENSGGTAHSEYILALSETGILGFIAFILAISRWAWLAFHHSYKFNDKDTDRHSGGIYGFVDLYFSCFF